MNSKIKTTKRSRVQKRPAGSSRKNQRWLVAVFGFVLIMSVLSGTLYALTRTTLSLPAVLAIADGQATDTYNAFPDATALNDGSLLTVYRVANQHQDAGGKVVAKRSTDNGATWSSEVNVAVPPTGSNKSYGTGGITVLPSGRILVGYVSLDAVTNTTATNFTSNVAASDDNGTTWTQLGAVAGTGFTEWSYPSGMLTLPDGSALLAMYGKDKGSANNYVRISRSTNGGAAWTGYGKLIWGSKGAYTDNRQWQEPRLTFGPNNTLVMALRSPTFGSGDPGSIWLVSSTDSGKNWSVPKQILAKASGMPSISRLHNGQYAVMYRDMNVQPYPVRYAVSFDLNSWATAGDFTQGISTGRMLYGAWVPQNDRTLVMYATEGPSGSTGYATVWQTAIP